ncbi:MAG: peptidyl-prolyl cis-trans isomerase [Candidatus Omnitrophica bacterium]|nr:peptidyl-prolyl cis-trans isomerase [Candidatus Omnitrophota bacterium]
MNRIINFLLLAFCLAFPSHCLYAQDKMVAIVNNEIITQKDLNDFLNFIRVQYSRELNGKELDEKVDSARHDLLQRLIEDRLMLQQAKTDNITVDSSRVKGKVDEIKKRYATESDFERDLASQGLVQADLENKIREQMLTFTVIEQKVRSKIMVKPEEVTNFYNQNREMFLKPQEKLFTVAVLRDKPSAEGLSRDLRRGDELDGLQEKYSFTVSNLAVAQGQDLRGGIEDKIAKMSPGDVSEPLPVDGQYYVFKLDGMDESRQMTLEQSQGKIQAYLFETKLKERISDWLDELKKHSYIKIIDN